MRSSLRSASASKVLSTYRPPQRALWSRCGDDSGTLWGGRSGGARYAFTLTYRPGASSIAFSFPPPGSRAGTSSSPCDLIHSIQSGHHEPGCSFAFFSQASSVPLPAPPPVQYWYLPLFGGLTTPAMWPEPDSTNFTGPPKNFEPRNADLAGAM